MRDAKFLIHFKIRNLFRRFPSGYFIQVLSYFFIFLQFLSHGILLYYCEIQGQRKMCLSTLLIIAFMQMRFYRLQRKSHLAWFGLAWPGLAYLLYSECNLNCSSIQTAETATSTPFIKTPLSPTDRVNRYSQPSPFITF